MVMKPTRKRSSSSSSSREELFLLLLSLLLLLLLHVQFVVPTSSSSTTAITTAPVAFQLPRIFGGGGVKNPARSTATTLSKRRDDAKRKVLDAVSNTNNGKTATAAQQKEVLRLVRTLETQFPPSPKLLVDPDEASRLLEGVWYLQYTSPSNVTTTSTSDTSDDASTEEEGDGMTTTSETDDDAWKPVDAAEGDSNIETRPFRQRGGSISAVGVPVETANRPTTQTIDVENMRVSNRVETDWGSIYAAGTFRVSTVVPTRAVVKFDTLDFVFDALDGWTLNAGFVFDLVNAITNSTENGWLETTYVDEDTRIGRGNKGTLFVLTREPNAVSP